MSFPLGAEYYDEIVEPSQGRVRAIRLRPGLTGYQDPDMVIVRHYADGTSRRLGPRLIAHEVAVERMSYDFDANRVRDSFGRFVGVANLRLPSTGRVADFAVLQARYKRLGIDPRRFQPADNQEIVERIVFVDREGNLVTRYTSYGLGSKYDRSKRGGWFRAEASRALGVEEGKRIGSRELQKAVVQREFLVKETVPRSAGVGG